MKKEPEKKDLPTPRKYNYHWLRLGLFILIAVIAPFFLFSLYYYNHHIEQQELRVFRSLQELQSSIKLRIDNMGKIHDKAVFSSGEINQTQTETDLLIKDYEAQQDQQFEIKQTLQQISALQKTPQISKDQFNKQFGSKVGYLTEQLTTLQESAKKTEDKVKKQKGNIDKAIASNINTSRDFLSSIRQTVGLQNLEFLYAQSFLFQQECRINSRPGITHLLRTNGFPKQTMLLTLNRSHIHNKSIDTKNSPIGIQLLLGDLIEAQVTSLPTKFDQIILIDNSGSIYYKSSPKHLSTIKNAGRYEFAPFSHSYINYDNMLEILHRDSERSFYEKSGTDKKQIEAPGNTITSKIVEHTVGDMQFRYFIQPVQLPVLGNDCSKKQNYYLIGVINDQHFQQTALTANPVLVGIALLSIIIILALLPILKIWLADKYTYFTKHLRTTVILSLLIFFAFSTFLVCFLTLQAFDNHMSANEVLQLNKKLKEEFLKEITQTVSDFYNNIEKFKTENCLYPAADKNATDKLETACEHSILPRFRLTGKITAAGNETEPCNSNPEQQKGCFVKIPTFYDFMLLNDTDGKPSSPVVSIKTSKLQKNTSLQERVYYQNAKSNNLWQVKLPQPTKQEDGRNYKFFMERIISYLDGQRETIISTTTSINDKRHIPITNSRFDSLFYRVLAPHMSYAVIDSFSGLVLFHSSPERNLIENFIDETEGNPELIAKLYHQKSGSLEMNYQGKPITAYLSPLFVDEQQQLPWTLITFKSLDLQQNLQLIVALSTGVFFIFIFICCILIFFLCDILTHFKLSRACTKYLAKKYCLPASLIAITLFSFFQYLNIEHKIQGALDSYASHYQQKQCSQRRAVFKKIYQNVNREIINPTLTEETFVEKHSNLYDKCPTNKQPSQALATNSQSACNSFLESFFSTSPLEHFTSVCTLKLIIPAISYSTGVIKENLITSNKSNKHTDNYKQNSYINNLTDKLSDNLYLSLITIIFLLIILHKFTLFISKKIISLLFITEKYSERKPLEMDMQLVCEKITTTNLQQIFINTELDLKKKLISNIRSAENSPELIIIDDMASLQKAPKVALKHSILVILDFPALTLEENNRVYLIELLDTFQEAGNNILIFSDIVPGYWLNVIEQFTAHSYLEDTGINEEIYRWSTILSNMQINILHDNTTDVIGEVNQSRESKTNDQTTSDHEPDRGIMDSRFGLFHQQWSLCTFDEKSILVSLAQNQLLNPSNKIAIQSLYFRGLIDLTPEPKISDNQFKQFVLSSYRKNKIDEWHRHGSHSAWNAILPVILTLLLLLAIFLFSTGKDALQYVMAIIASTATALPVLSGVFEFVKNRNTG